MLKRFGSSFFKFRGKEKLNEVMNSSQATNVSVPSSCLAAERMFGNLQQPSFFFQGVLILYIIINIITVPFTAVLNALMMIAVKTKSRLRAQKSNIVLAMLALTDFFVGILAQPILTAGMISVLLQESDCQSGVIQIGFIVLANCLFTSSVLHLAFASGERYVAIKYPYQYITIVTESRLLIASLLTWLLAVTVHFALAINTDVFFSINNTVIGLSVAVIVFCHLSVFLETRRHEQQVAAQQITEEARKQFEKDKKAFKLTSTITGVLLLCYSPLMFSRTVLLNFLKPSLNTFYIIDFFALTVVFLNSLLNPVIYCIRIRHFRVAMIELTFRNVTLAKAEEMEMQWFGAKNVVVGRETGQDQGRPEQQNTERLNVS